VADERQLRSEIAREREELSGAVGSLREEVDRAKRRLPAIAAGAIALVAGLRVGVRRLRRRR
jgi:hypothetical protein